MRNARILLILAAVVGVVAYAQQQSLILGSDTSSGGTVRRVQVDSQGRLVISGGGSGGAVEFACTSRSQSVTSVGLTASTLPTALANRWMVRVCNSAENSGIPLVKCRDDGVNPSMGTANAGEVLEVGDCAIYYTSAAIRCISDSSSTAVTQAECD